MSLSSLHSVEKKLKVPIWILNMEDYDNKTLYDQHPYCHFLTTRHLKKQNKKKVEKEN